ncbi:hypothetical protein BC629DRAFT_430985 [Irpex lacteus]|nr:hypothetical protein BC629DRAFT_430985 [Irpex lacteus]
MPSTSCPMSSASPDDSIMTLRRSVRECVRSITPVQDLGVRTEAGTAKRALVASLKTNATGASGNDLQTLQHLSSDALWAASGDSFRFMATTYKASHSKSEGDCVLPVSNHKPEQCLDLAYILEGRTDDVYYGSRKEIFQVLAAYNDRLKALETERSIYNERILCLETSKTSLQNETWLLKEEFKRMSTILEARSTNLPLQSGSYIITNAGFKNELGFPIDPAHPDRSVLSAYSSRSDTQKPIWDVSCGDALKYTIRSNRCGLYANAWKFSGIGDKVLGVPEEREFYITSPENDGQYMCTLKDVLST